jgi:hypothetical protein
MKITTIQQIKEEFKNRQINKHELRKFLQDNGAFHESIKGRFLRITELSGVGKIERRNLIRLGLVIPDPFEMEYEKAISALKRQLETAEHKVRLAQAEAASIRAKIATEKANQYLQQP